MSERQAASASGAVYRAEIRETGNGWFWRVEVDVRNGHAWSGDSESFSEAARQAARRLLALGEAAGSEVTSERETR